MSLFFSWFMAHGGTEISAKSHRYIYYEESSCWHFISLERSNSTLTKNEDTYLLSTSITKRMVCKDPNGLCFKKIIQDYFLKITLKSLRKTLWCPEKVWARKLAHFQNFSVTIPTMAGWNVASKFHQRRRFQSGERTIHFAEGKDGRF